MAHTGGPPHGPVPVPDTSGFTGSIFGWTWLGRWAAEDADPKIVGWLTGWVNKWTAAANATLTGEITDAPEVVIEKFKADLANQTWWQEKTAAWQAIQKLRYGVDTPAGEYDAVVESAREYVLDAALRLGIAPPSDEDLEELITSDNGLLMSGYDVFNGVLSPNKIASDKFIENALIPAREIGVPEGVPEFGAGELRDIYNWIESLAANNYITLSPEEKWDMVSRIKREDMNQQEAYGTIATRVGDQYDFLDGSSILSRINNFTADAGYPGRTGAGITGWGGSSSLKSHLSPLRDSIALTWGMTGDEVRLQDLFGNDLQGLDGQDGLIVGGQTDDDGPERFMNSREARMWARQQPQYQQTAEYGTQMGNIVRSILETFGAI
tara:strand:+ start:5337 stop:6479 length:1143 start_codon:yes stop_codon:yes gene_type:complete